MLHSQTQNVYEKNDLCLSAAEDSSGNRPADPVRKRQRSQRLVQGAAGHHQQPCEQQHLHSVNIVSICFKQNKVHFKSSAVRRFVVQHEGIRPGLTLCGCLIRETKRTAVSQLPFCSEHKLNSSCSFLPTEGKR